MSADALWRALLLLIVAAPLPLGSNRPWAWSALGLASGLLLLSWCYLVQTGKASIRWHAPLTPAALLFSMALGWIAFQTFVDVPDSIAHPLWPLAEAALSKQLQSTISSSTDQAVNSILRLLAYIAIFWLSLQLGRDSRRAWELMRWLGWASFTYAAYGLIVYISGNETILWFDRWTYHNDLTSTFVNRNSYATFAAIGILVALGLAIQKFRSDWRISDRSLPLLNRWTESFLKQSVVYSIFAVIIAMAWLQTHSRMGFVAGALGVAVFLLLLRTARLITSGWSSLVVLAATGAFLVSVSGENTVARLSATTEFDRVALFSVVVEGIKAASLVGHGYGSFASIFLMVRDSSISPAFDYTEAHNSYLELAFELGVPAAILVVGAICWLVLYCIVSTYSKRPNRILPAVAAAVSIAVGVHALADFSIQMPAIAAAFAAILGVGCAQGVPSIKGASAESLRLQPHDGDV